MYGANLNGNLLCAVCIDTVGRDPYLHDMLEVCVMPLDRTYDRDRRASPFSVQIRPIHDFREETEHYREEAYTRTHQTRGRKPQYMQAMTYGMSRIDAAEIFERWFETLNLKEKKRIVPLAYDWPFTGGFIRKWLDDDVFDNMFDYRYRDLLPICCAENDNAEYNMQDVPFQKVDMSFIGAKLGFPPGVLQLPIMERALTLGQMYLAYQLKRNTWK